MTDTHTNDNAVQEPAEPTCLQGFTGKKTRSMRKKRRNEGPQKPQIIEAQQSYRNHSPMETPEKWCLCYSKGLKRFLLAQVKRTNVKTPTFKRRPQKRRNAGAPLCAHATTRNKVAPKHLTNCRLIEKTRNERCGMNIRTKGPNRHSNSSNTRQAFRCAFSNMLPRESLRGYRGRPTVKTHRLRRSDSTERLCHPCWKHRWKQKYGLLRCSYHGHYIHLNYGLINEL